MLRFSAHLTQLFTELPFSERFAAAAEQGFAACEFRSPFESRPEEIGAWVRASGIPNILFNAPAGDWKAGERGLAALPGRENEFRESIAAAMRYADVIGTPMLHVMAGVPVPGADWRECRATFLHSLRFAARELAKAGRAVLIEAINRQDVPGYFLSTQADAFRLREEVGEANVLVQMDCYHACMTGESVAQTLVRHQPQIGHVQIAGAPGRHEPDTGDLDYHDVFDQLERIRYAGYIGCEYAPRGSTVDGLEWMRRLSLVRA